MIKKLAILFATLTMVLCCTTTAFAAGTGTITVENAKETETYTAYKIFDVVYSTDGKKYAYTIDSANEWFADVQVYATTENKLTLTQKQDETTYYVVEFQDGFSAPKFAEYLKTKVDTKTGGTNLTVTGGKATASNLDLGYYFVKTTTAALCNLTTTKPEAKIYDKNIGPEINKTQNRKDNPTVDGSVQVGDTINYEITGKVPSTTGYTTYTYIIEDTMDNGLTFKKDTLKVYVGDSTTELEDTYKNIEFTPDATNPTGFKLIIKVDQLQGKVGEKITVKYDAVVNENAVTVVSKNTAKLVYSNNPNSDSVGENSPEPTKVFTAKIVIDKHDATDNNVKLDGVVFKLYKLVEGNKKYYKYTPASGTTDAKVEWVDDIAQATEIITAAGGKAEIKGLENGTYYLKEISTLDGYNLLTEDKAIAINGSKDNTTSLEVKADISNKKGALLPETGGIGTIGLTALAVAVVACALFLPKKKNRA
ncbi:MAG: isopeptide-forming domain-containing fimbrial protein [Erysipelotrichaceae bacterium]|nr:isopeptide-forming domain-containing fimbrial protein [Solobacterium sp.]MDY3795021.1 isopeptide-forming domain-containing fimbrial protein [Erysipelotrichaceae bacterium]